MDHLTVRDLRLFLEGKPDDALLKRLMTREYGEIEVENLTYDPATNVVVID
jgi:hypothetical protein